MTTSISDAGLVLASGNLIDLRSAMPSSGSYVAGDVVLESTTTARISGWKRLTTGSGHVLNTDWVYFTNLGSGTVIPTTSGVAADWLIPAGVKRITLSLAGVSSNGTSSLCVQAGSGGSVETSGYVATGNNIAGSVAITSTIAVPLMVTATASSVYSGQVVFTLLNPATNLWVISGFLSDSSPTLQMGAGSKTLAGVLDRIRLTSLGGVNTLDAGSAAPIWEF